MPESADNDREARAALWRAISVASGDVRHRFRVRSIRVGDGSLIRTNANVADGATWQLVEALSLLGVILRAEDASADVIDIFGKTGPVKTREDGIERPLWAQQALRGDKSALNGRPDLIVTSSPKPPHPHNAIRIIEAKCTRPPQLGISMG